MSKPNSYTTIIRGMLARWIQPKPDIGEGWCLECSLNGGNTTVVPVDALLIHGHTHYDIKPEERIRIVFSTEGSNGTLT